MTNKSVSVWSSLKNSFYNPAFYKVVPSFPFGKVMGYLLLVSTLGYLVFLGQGAWFLYQNREQIEEGIDKAISSYPEDLELTFTDGKLSSNVQEPYFFPEEGIQKFFEGKEDINVDSDTPKYLMVVDTKTPFTSEQFENYNTIVWMSGDTAYVEDKNRGLQAIPYQKDFNQVINKETVIEFGTKLLEKIKVPLIIAGSVALVVVDFGLFLFYAVYLLLASLLYFFFSQVAGKKREYVACYRIAVYAFTPALALSLLIQVIGLFVPLQMPPFLFTGILLLTVLINVKEQRATLKS
jgi:hypothetical protein